MLNSSAGSGQAPPKHLSGTSVRAAPLVLSLSKDLPERGAGCEVPASAGMAQGLVRPRKGMKMGRRGLSLASVLGTPTFPERCFGSASGSAQHDNRGGEVPACAGTTGRYFHRNDRQEGE